ncbi:AfsA-related hotdog domain-containing protein [Streptomyces sp. NPDC048191]|uniref:AfsA-related hotdog domain-containing protein n=1 Tax=Streptomyces sp. NPDC048191 TaxID=3155484 RepID=UPI00340D836E
MVDKDDPFFFDHTLDHLPGILIVAGLLDLVRATDRSPRPNRRLTLSLDFHKFCGLDDDVTLSVSPPPAGDGHESRWELHGAIGPDPACGGTAVLRDDPAARCAPAAPGRTGDTLPVADLSHRARPENCFIDAAWWHADRLLARVRRPGADHALRDRPLEHLIEAARQFATLIGHAGFQNALDSKFILRTLEADLPLTPAPGDIRMEWTRRPVERRTFDLMMRLYRRTGGSFDEEIGSANFHTLIVDPYRYERIRNRRPRVEERVV